MFQALPLCDLGDGELVEQVLGQQTAENGESMLDNLIRQLQNEHVEHSNAEEQPEEADGMFSCMSLSVLLMPIA